MKISNLIRIFLVGLCLSVFANPNPAYADKVCNPSGECIQSSGKTTAASSKECDAVAYSAKRWEGCVFCKLYKPLFIAAQSVTRSSSKTFGGPFANLLAIGMALFIAYETLKMVSSFTQQDIRKYLNTVSVQFFKMLIAFFLLKNMSTFYNLLVNPLLLAGFDFGSAVAELSQDGINIDTSSLADSNDPTFGYAIYDAVQKFSTGCQARIAQVMAFGKFLLCFSKEEGWKEIIPDFALLFNGVIIFILGSVIMISFGFLLIDAMVQMGIFGALAPFCLASWPFKITAQYTKSGWKIFSGVFLTYAMAGVTLRIVFALVAASITSGSADGAGSVNELANLADTGTPDQIREKLQGGFSSVLLALACSIIAFRLTGKITELVGNFGGDGGPGIGSDMGRQAMTAAKRLGTSAAGAAAKGAKAVSDATGLTEAAEKARDKIGAGIKKAVGAPSRAIKAVTGSKTATAIRGKVRKELKDTFIDTPKENLKDMRDALKETKLGKVATKAADKLANSKFGKAVGGAAEKTGEFLSDPKEGLRKMDQKIAGRINGSGGSSSGANPGNMANNAPSSGGSSGSAPKGGSSGKA